MNDSRTTGPANSAETALFAGDARDHGRPRNQQGSVLCLVSVVTALEVEIVSHDSRFGWQAVRAGESLPLRCGKRRCEERRNPGQARIRRSQRETIDFSPGHFVPMKNLDLPGGREQKGVRFQDTDHGDDGSLAMIYFYFCSFSSSAFASSRCGNKPGLSSARCSNCFASASCPRSARTLAR